MLRSTILNKEVEHSSKEEKRTYHRIVLDEINRNFRDSIAISKGLRYVLFALSNQLGFEA